MKQLKVEQQRLKRRQKELEEIIDIEWKEVVRGFRPSVLIKHGAISLLHKILKNWIPMK